MRMAPLMFILLLCVVFAGGVSRSEIKGSDVQYSSGGTTLKGYLAYDTAVRGRRPGVLVVHEWWGLNDYPRKRARQLAELGYTALAVDMYGEGKQASHPDDAGKFAGEIMKNMPLAKARFLAALDMLRKEKTVDTARIGAIGYCFGGGTVLNLARMGVDLKGVVSFHGSLAAASPAKKGGVKAKMLVCHGEADAFSTRADIDAFTSEMKEAGVDLTFKSYPDAKHSFTNPDADGYAKKFNIPLGYNAKADSNSWKDMKAFFRKVFARK